MASADEIFLRIKSKAKPEQLGGMARFGMDTGKRLGLSVPEMRKIAKEAGKNHKAALELWKSGIADAQIVASLIAEPDKLTEAQMEDWVKDFNSWDVCDQVCMNLFDKTPLAWKKVQDWSVREEEFVKRAAYALIACLAWHIKELEDDSLIQLFPVIKNGATDERNFVKKSVSWALRHIGKRNKNLNKAAITCAEEIQQNDSKAARWIASDVLRELRSEAVQKRLSKK